MWIRRRDLPPIFLLFLLIFLILITLTQILVFHSGLYGRPKSSEKIRKFQKDMQELEAYVRSVLSDNVPTMKEFQENFRLQAKARRTKEILQEARDYSVLMRKCLSVVAKDKNNTINSCQRHNSKLCRNEAHYKVYKSYLKELNNIYTSKYNLSYCDTVPRYLKGRTNVSIEIGPNMESEVRRRLKSDVHVDFGGSWKPRDCLARHRVAIIVPYRDRLIHLLIFLHHIHPMLQRQELSYRIFVVEQTGNQTFNKGRLMNSGFIEASKMGHFDCFIFHDVDLIPEDDRNVYSCPRQPRHLSVAIDEMNYKLAYKNLVGGVLNMRLEHFLMVNGYSNLYWGWGAEDDDMAYRTMVVGLRITRPPEGVARYKMIRHVKRTPSDFVKRHNLLYTGPRRYQVDGLNSLVYERLAVVERPHYTYVLVDVGDPPVDFW